MAPTGVTAGERARGAVKQGAPGRERIRLVPPTGGRRSRGEAGVRWSRVQAVRARIAAGYYDRDEVRDQLVDALMSELDP